MVDLTTAPQVDAGAASLAATIAEIAPLQAFAQLPGTPDTLKRIPMQLLLDLIGDSGAAFFDDYAAADAATLNEGQIVLVIVDETRGGHQVLYKSVAGALVFEAFADPAAQFPTNYQDLSKRRTRLGLGPSTNMMALNRKLFANATAPAQVKVVAFGDSIATSIWHHLIQTIQRSMGGKSSTVATAGVTPTAGGVGGHMAVPGTPTGLTTVTNDYTRWPEGVYQQFTAGTYTFKDQTSAFNPVADDLRIFFGLESGAGSVEVFDNGVSVGTLNCNNGGTLDGGWISWTRGSVTNNAITMTVTGTVRVFKAIFMDTTKPGVAVVPVAQGGIILKDCMSSAAVRAVFQKFLTDWAPDIFSLRFNDSATNFTAGTTADDWNVNLEHLGGVLDASIPLADKMMISCNPNWGAGKDNANVYLTNQQLAEFAAIRGYDYFDTYWIFKGDAYQPTGGEITDGIHANSQLGVAYEAAALMEQMNLSLASYAMTPRAVNDITTPSRLANGTVFERQNADERLSFDCDVIGRDWNIDILRSIDFRTGAVGSKAQQLAVGTPGGLGHGFRVPFVTPFNTETMASATRRLQAFGAGTAGLEVQRLVTGSWVPGGINAADYYSAGVKVVGARRTGWTADTGTAKRTATATYSGTASATYTQAEMTAVMNALRDATQTIKALKDDLIAHGLIGA